mmetsp:Transcript_12613/g.25549  ORF Transcript_12613/g.25549 Transcript_12613/m.25549 type:complete len:105 (-) Transcript_12613:152-466(-)
MGTRLWDTLVLHRRRDTDVVGTSNDALHDMALTAQPPVLKRNITARRRRQQANETAVLVVEEVLVGLALTVAVGLLTRYLASVVRGLFVPSSKSDKGADTKPSS